MLGEAATIVTVLAIIFLLRSAYILRKERMVWAELNRQLVARITEFEKWNIQAKEAAEVVGCCGHPSTECLRIKEIEAEMREGVIGEEAWRIINLFREL